MGKFVPIVSVSWSIRVIAVPDPGTYFYSQSMAKLAQRQAGVKDFPRALLCLQIDRREGGESLFSWPPLCKVSWAGLVLDLGHCSSPGSP